MPAMFRRPLLPHTLWKTTVRAPLNADCLIAVCVVAHKVRVVKHLLQQDARPLLLAGHSIGAYMCLRILRRLEPHECRRIVGCFLLMPTIANIGSSPNGLRLSRFFSAPWRFFLRNAARVVRWCPSFVIRTLASARVPIELAHLCEQLLYPSVVDNVLFMAGDEMALVRELHEWRGDELLLAAADLVCSYHSRADPWCPLKDFHRLKKQFPDSRWELCSEPVDIPHAFVLDRRGTRVVAAHCVQWAAQRLLAIPRDTWMSQLLETEQSAARARHLCSPAQQLASALLSPGSHVRRVESRRR